jgi:hypothetical protein
VATVHDTVTHEDYCTDSNVGSITQQQFSGFVAAALFNGLQDWETNVNGFLPIDRGFCDDIEKGPGLEGIEMHFRLNSAP